MISCNDKIKADYTFDQYIEDLKSDEFLYNYMNWTLHSLSKSGEYDLLQYILDRFLVKKEVMQDGKE